MREMAILANRNQPPHLLVAEAEQLRRQAATQRRSPATMIALTQLRQWGGGCLVRLGGRLQTAQATASAPVITATANGAGS